MAIPHARTGQPVSVHSETSSSPQTTTLIKTKCIEVLRVVMSKGKQVARHKVPGEITLQCFAGSVTHHFGDRECELSPGKLTYFPVDKNIR